MTDSYEAPRPTSASGGAATPSPAPTVAEDLLLLLFQPDSGTVAGEGTLYYVLAGAVLADLGLGGHVRTGTGVTGALTVQAVAENPPDDHLLRASWEYVAEKPRGVQTVLAAMGPTLRAPLLDRLVERGDIRRVTRRMLGLFTTSALEDGNDSRRGGVLADVRAVLVDGAPATPRTAALAALLYGSGTLPQFDRDIPWTSAVISRAEELKAGSWGADAAANAVARTLTATIVNSVIFAAAALPRR
ncbi:GOLPH3/VPS74 family protein [Microbacterium sp. MAHUQ-60]|uniref:GOLPH3/VPS74 family protein n=1 Tax=unclassified Microbacterium TaxID=2609290 RepID=UPI00360AA83E